MIFAELVERQFVLVHPSLQPQIPPAADTGKRSTRHQGSSDLNNQHETLWAGFAGHSDAGMHVHWLFMVATGTADIVAALCWCACCRRLLGITGEKETQEAEAGAANRCVAPDSCLSMAVAQVWGCMLHSAPHECIGACCTQQHTHVSPASCKR